MEINNNQKEKKSEILEKIEINDNIIFYKIKNNEDGKIYYNKKIKLKDESKEELEKVENEIKNLSTINSEYVFNYVKCFMKNGNFNVLMEYYEDINLRQLINKYKNEKEFIKQKNVYYLTNYICLGIKAIHDKRIIHGNLSPENIYLTKDKKIKIGNFSLFKQLNNYNDYLESNNINYNNYFAPEIIKEETISNKVDIWSLGCIIYELCTLEYCFENENIVCLYNKIINEKHLKINLKIYENELQEIIDSCLNKDPKDRPNIDQIYDIINKYCENKKNKKCEQSEIKIILKITSQDINKDIYFLDNSEYDDENNNIHFHNSLKELDETKVDLYIDNKKYKYTKFNNFHEAKEYEIIIKFNSYLKNCSNMFYNCKNIKKIDLSKFNTKNVTNMNSMFYNCENLIDINLSNFNTENVITMKDMFHGCNNLTNIDLHSFDTKNVINISGLFYGCEKLEKLNIKNFDTHNVVDMSNLFRGCNNLVKIDLSSLDTTKVKYMSGMFYICEKLTNLNLSNFNFQNVEKTDEMFGYCNNLTNIIFSSSSTINLKSMEKMFYNCTRLINLDLSNFNTEKVENMNKMFYGCENMQSLNILNFDMNKVNNCYQMLYNCNSLKTISINKNNNILQNELKEEKINPEIISNM